MSTQLAIEQADSLHGVAEPAESQILLGHADAARSVIDAYRAGKLHHALLLTGPKGIGKATFAFHLARYLLENPDAAQAQQTLGATSPDSPIFRQVASSASPGVLHLARPFDEKSKKFKTVITVEETRRISRFLSLHSHDGSYRIVIIDPVDDMNRNAANALLKNLEEPPPRVLFLLISHAPGGLLPTIRSRCQTVRLQPLDDEDMTAVMDAIDAPLPGDDQARSALLERAGGSARQAVLLSKYGGSDIISAIGQIARAKSRDVRESYKIADAVAAKDGEVRFRIFNAHMLDMLASAARQAALDADTARADRIAGVWRDASLQISEVETYNLDKRQHVVSLIERVASAIE